MHTLKHTDNKNVTISFLTDRIEQRQDTQCQSHYHCVYISRVQ
jgi:hypothetical protein